MKKNLLSILCSALMMTVLFTSCSKDDKDDSNFLGKWNTAYAGEYDYNNPENKLNESTFNHVTLEFLEDGSLLITEEDEIYEDRWKDERFPNKILIDGMVFYIVKITKNELFLLLNPMLSWDYE